MYIVAAPREPLTTWEHPRPFLTHCADAHIHLLTLHARAVNLQALTHDARPLLLNNPCAPQLVGPYAPPLYVDVCPSVCRSIGANKGLRDKRRQAGCAAGGRLRGDYGAGGGLFG